MAVAVGLGAAARAAYPAAPGTARPRQAPRRHILAWANAPISEAAAAAAANGPSRPLPRPPERRLATWGVRPLAEGEDRLKAAAGGTLTLAEWFEEGLVAPKWTSPLPALRKEAAAFYLASEKFPHDGPGNDLSLNRCIGRIEAGSCAQAAAGTAKEHRTGLLQRSPLLLMLILHGDTEIPSLFAERFPADIIELLQQEANELRRLLAIWLELDAKHSSSEEFENFVRSSRLAAVAANETLADALAPRGAAVPAPLPALPILATKEGRCETLSARRRPSSGLIASKTSCSQSGQCQLRFQLHEPETPRPRQRTGRDLSRLGGRMMGLE